MIHNKYQSVMHSANTKRIDRIAIISLRRISKFTTLAVAGQRTKTWLLANGSSFSLLDARVATSVSPDLFPPRPV